MAGIEDGIAQTLAYAADDSHGYELQCRRYGIGTDCAGLMILYAAAVEGVPLEQYPNFHTWTEVDVLGSRGWTVLPFDYASAKRGDIFLRALNDNTGHTVLYLGNGRIVGAENNWDGVRGDSSGAEVTERSYYAYKYNYMIRWEGDEVTDADIKNIAKAVWEQKLDKPAGGTSKAGDLLRYTHYDTLRGTEQVTRTDDPTGRDMNLNDHDHIKWLAARQADQNEVLAEIQAKLDVVMAALGVNSDSDENPETPTEDDETTD